jgi:hypothetical protein
MEASNEQSDHPRVESVNGVAAGALAIRVG